DGRFEITGMPKSPRSLSLLAHPPENTPYFVSNVALADPPGLGPVEVEVSMIRGIAARGRVTHALPGQPLAGGRVEYNPLYPNPYVTKLLDDTLGRPCSMTRTAMDGSYTLAVLPGPGVLAFQAEREREAFMTDLVTKAEIKALLGEVGLHTEEML